MCHVNLGRWIIPDYVFDFPYVRISILLVGTVSLSLGWAVQVWFVEQSLNSQEYLLQGNGRFPARLILLGLLIKDR